MIDASAVDNIIKWEEIHPQDQPCNDIRNLIKVSVVSKPHTVVGLFHRHKNREDYCDSEPGSNEFMENDPGLPELPMG